jgi:hypothetical protein
VTRACVCPQQDALLDFYGVPVKAAEVRSHIDRMRLLADKVPTRRSLCRRTPVPTPLWRSVQLTPPFFVHLLHTLHRRQQLLHRRQQQRLLRPHLCCTHLSTCEQAKCGGAATLNPEYVGFP